MARHYAVVPNENGQPLRFPLKAWVRQNLAQLPGNFPHPGTTRRYRNALVPLGWSLQPGIDTVLVIKHDANNSIEYANGLLEDLEVDGADEEEELEEAQELTFGLERDLQQALRKNIEFLERGLRIVDNGQERNTEAGRIDITAEDAEGNIVVIELKAPIAKPEVIAQTLAYMEAISVEEQKSVRGIIVASDFAERVKLAARQIPNLKLVTYSFQFSFGAVK